MLPCPVKSLFGIDCPGCGMQRSFIELIRGNIGDSLLLYPALIPVMLMMILLIAHLVIKFDKGGIWLKNIFILNTILIFGSYFSRLLISNI
jgi:hypothetical protein